MGEAFVNFGIVGAEWAEDEKSPYCRYPEVGTYVPRCRGQGLQQIRSPRRIE